MLEFPIYFGELAFDGLFDTRALLRAFPENILRETRFLAPGSEWSKRPQLELRVSSKL